MMIARVTHHHIDARQLSGIFPVLLVRHMLQPADLLDPNVPARKAVPLAVALQQQVEVKDLRSAIGPSRTSGDVRVRAAIASIADVNRARSRRLNFAVCGRVPAAAHFMLMFAALITFAHFSVSDAM
jgi:hypothetical protein